MKRIRPAPMGRAYRYQRRMAHIEIELAEKHKTAVSTAVETPAAAPAKPAVRKPAVKKAAAKKTVAKKTVAKKTAAKKAAPKAKK
jgi:large subunit ribosomal protein L22